MLIPFTLALRTLPLSRKKPKQTVLVGHNWRIHHGRVTCDLRIPSTELPPYGARAWLDQPFSPAVLHFNSPALCTQLISRLPQDETFPWAEMKSLLAPEHVHDVFLV